MMMMMMKLIMIITLFFLGVEASMNLEDEFDDQMEEKESSDHPRGPPRYVSFLQVQSDEDVYSWWGG